MDIEKHNRIIRKLQKGRQLFEDEEFRADNSSLTYDQNDFDFKWLRPKEIHPDPHFVKDGFSRFDVNQGNLENCWVLASIAKITLRNDLLSQVIVPGQTIKGKGYCGAFRFRFQPFGRIREIMVDDRLPTKDGDVVYARSRDGEFWVCLLEKALAKLYGCYESLKSGLGLEITADLTGGVCEVFYLHSNVDKRREMAIASIRSGLLNKLPASTASRPQKDMPHANVARLGILPGHDYLISGTVQVSHNGEKVDLIRIYNPWGPMKGIEWLGKWSDNDPNWTPELMKLVMLDKKADGESWMELDDFLKYFHCLTFLHLANNTETGVIGCGWKGKNIYGEWYYGQRSKEFYNDGKYRIGNLGRTAKGGVAHAVLSIEEPGQREVRECDRKYVRKAIKIYKDVNGKKTRVLIEEEPVVEAERAALFRVTLPPSDNYIVVPVPLDLPKGKRLEFLLRVFTEP